MKVALFPFDETFCKDEIFNLSSVYNRDNCLYPYVYVKEKLLSQGVELHTYDVGILKEYDKLILFNYNSLVSDVIGTFFKKEDKILYLFEPPPILPMMWSPDSLQKFKEQVGRIYTYAETLLDNQSFFKFNYPQSIPENQAANKVNFSAQRPYLLTLIGSNHSTDYPGELYTLRRQLVKYFSMVTEDFHIYGSHWELPSYKGRCSNKLEVLRNYTYSLCIENYAMPGYITEKIFDSFFAGTIPVYFGAPDVAKHIPSNSFIHLRDFNSMEAMVHRLQSMPTEEIAQYRRNIESFLSGKAFYPFSLDSFADSVQSVLCP